MIFQVITLTRIFLIFDLDLGQKNYREGLYVCMNYEFNLLHHVGVLAKRLRGARRGRQYPFGPNGQRGKNDYRGLLVLSTKGFSL